METAILETLKRDRVIEIVLEELKNISNGIILTGSMAYGRDHHVHTNSDIDIVIVVDDLKRVIPYFFDNKIIADALSHRFFEGYCMKRLYNNIEISYHILTKDAFDIITKCFVADIRVYRPSPKEGQYVLKGFEGNTYKYNIKNKHLPDLHGGVRTIVPIGFMNDDRYYMGVYRDKLICCSKVLYDPTGDIRTGIEKLWENIVRNLIDESIRLYKIIDLTKMNIFNALAKNMSLTQDCCDNIHKKTLKYVEIII